jgi:hypothetical protein
MEQSPCWEANNFLASQEISRIFWKPEVHHRIHKSPQLVIVSQINGFLTFSSPKGPF